jgi:GPI-anchor transamidase subunit T
MCRRSPNYPCDTRLRAPANHITLIVIRDSELVTICTRSLKTMPWHIESFLHMLSMSCGDGEKCGVWSWTRSSSPLILIVDHLYMDITYTPSQPHAKPALLQVTLESPPHEILHLSFRVRKAFLSYKEHPVFIPPHGSSISQR